MASVPPSLPVYRGTRWQLIAPKRLPDTLREDHSDPVAMLELLVSVYLSCPPDTHTQCIVFGFGGR